MSSDFTVPPCSSLSDANNYTDEIHDVFNQHWTTLNNARQESIDRINKWRVDCKEHINKYAKEQKFLLNDYYNRLRPIFDEKYQENLEIANACHATQQVNLFNDLREACRLLKFQVATLEFSKHEMDRPEVILPEEPVKRESLQQLNTNIQNAARHRRRRNKENDNSSENTGNASASTPLNSITSNSKQTDDRLPSKIKSTRKNDQSKTDKDGLKNQAMNDDESYNKCPICFMIFPSSMTRDDRQQHVNEHYIDD